MMESQTLRLSSAAICAEVCESIPSARQGGREEERRGEKGRENVAVRPKTLFGKLGEESRGGAGCTNVGNGYIKSTGHKQRTDEPTNA